MGVEACFSVERVRLLGGPSAVITSGVMRQISCVKMLAVGVDKVACSRLRRHPLCLCLYWDMERGCADGTTCVEGVLFGWEPARGMYSTLLPGG
eukprot:1023579-Pelagomonas_calceolata.AAC.1